MNVNGNPAAVPQKADTTLITAINKQIKEIEKALPKHLTAERLARIAITAIRKTPRLGTCTKDSFMGSLMLAAQLGLDLGGKGHDKALPTESGWRPAPHTVPSQRRTAG